MLADARNSAATQSLDDALAELLDQPDGKAVTGRLDEAVKRWCHERPEGAGNPPDQEEMVRVLLGIMRNLRESAYRALFARHYRQLRSVDHWYDSRVDDVFVRLQLKHRGETTHGRSGQEPSQPTEQTRAPGHLDFRGKTPTDIDIMLRQSDNLVILGAPGAGKSVMLRHLAASCAEADSDDALLPVFLRLRDYAGGQEMLIAGSAVTFAEDAPPAPNVQRFL